MERAQTAVALLFLAAALGGLACKSSEAPPGKGAPSVGPGLSAPVPPLPAFAPETLRRRVSAADGRSWDAAFDISSDGEALLLGLRVKLVPGPDVARALLREKAEAWRRAVEGAWSGCALAETSEGRRAPLRLALTFGAADPHHEVIVRGGSGRSSPLHWQLYDPPQRVAHEVGHMLGAYDEYPGGALAPVDAVPSVRAKAPAQGGRAAASMMGVEGARIVPCERRHFLLLEGWLAQRPELDLRLVPAGEASFTGRPASRPAPEPSH